MKLIIISSLKYDLIKTKQMLKQVKLYLRNTIIAKPYLQIELHVLFWCILKLNTEKWNLNKWFDY